MSVITQNNYVDPRQLAFPFFEEENKQKEELEESQETEIMSLLFDQKKIFSKHKKKEVTIAEQKRIDNLKERIKGAYYLGVAQNKANAIFHKKILVDKIYHQLNKENNFLRNKIFSLLVEKENVTIEQVWKKFDCSHGYFYICRYNWINNIDDCQTKYLERQRLINQSMAMFISSHFSEKMKKEIAA